MAEIEDLKNTVAQTLEHRGVLNSIRAKLREEVFLALQAHENGEGGRSSTTNNNEKLTQLRSSPNGEQVLELVRELLEFCQLDHTLSVFQAEAKLATKARGRRSLQESLGLTNSKRPLLIDVFDGVHKGGSAMTSPSSAQSSAFAPYGRTDTKDNNTSSVPPSTSATTTGASSGSLSSLSGVPSLGRRAGAPLSSLATSPTSETSMAHGSGLSQSSSGSRSIGSSSSTSSMNTNANNSSSSSVTSPTSTSQQSSTALTSLPLSSSATNSSFTASVSQETRTSLRSNSGRRQGNDGTEESLSSSISPSHSSQSATSSSLAESKKAPSKLGSLGGLPPSTASTGSSLSSLSGLPSLGRAPLGGVPPLSSLGGKAPLTSLGKPSPLSAPAPSTSTSATGSSTTTGASKSGVTSATGRVAADDLGTSADFGGQSHDESMTADDDMKKLKEIESRLKELEKNDEEDPYKDDFAGDDGVAENIEVEMSNDGDVDAGGAYEDSYDRQYHESSASDIADITPRDGRTHVIGGRNNGVKVPPQSQLPSSASSVSAKKNDGQLGAAGRRAHDQLDESFSNDRSPRGALENNFDYAEDADVAF